MANAYLIECRPSGTFADALYVTLSLERGRENAMMTVIHEDGTVSKEAAYPEGEKSIGRLAAHMKALQEAERLRMESEKTTAELAMKLAGNIKNTLTDNIIVQSPTV